MPPIIEARGLTKRFGDTQALAGLDLVAESGRVTGQRPDVVGRAPDADLVADAAEHEARP